ncbi:hypothetical protein [Arthrobacter sp. Marseille-P9274]|uniref:hypothetical protein n=1 Tax=Arthrobacter sp. Marseille-P9274 TaxID=2866572 RepID=UPI0021C75644|nr:hypothetical protein [Arthrobacter sp. Marseille-P9274]
MSETKDRQVWLDQLVLELRLRNVPGATIGDAVATVRGHLADTGETPHQAFGEPADYARDLGLDQAAPAGFGVLIAVNLLGLLGLLILVDAAGPLAGGRAVDFTASDILLAAFAATAAWVLAASISVIARAKLLHSMLVGLGISVGTAALAFLLPDRPVVSLPALPLAISGTVLLVGAACWSQWQSSNRPDEVVDPVSGKAAGGRLSGILGTLGNWIMVVGAVPLVAIAVLAGG